MADMGSNPEISTDSATASTDQKTSDGTDDVKQWTLWGLGRGVDITKPTPWLEKTSFQVRKVDAEDIIITDEGGLLKGYSETVNNSTTLHSQVRAGVKAPDTPISIGVDAEYTRTDCSSRHVVGLKVKDRTISFQIDFEDVPKSRVETVKKAKEQIKNATILTPGRRVSTRTAKGDSNSTTEETFFNGEPFENRLCKWLWDCLEHRGVPISGNKTNEELYEWICKRCKHESDRNRVQIDAGQEDGEQGGTQQDGAAQSGALQDVEAQSGSQQDVGLQGGPGQLQGGADSNGCVSWIEDYIDHFIKHFGVTHYVSAIEIGALEYSVLTEKEYEKRVAAGGNASLTSQLYGGIEVSAKQTHLKKFKLRSSERKQIGKILNDKVEVEAVIGCQIRPISSLVKHPYLQLALKEGVKKYTMQKISTGGPYLITCGDDPIIYLTADSKTQQLTVTYNKEEADAFTVKILNESSSHHELEFALTSTLTKCKQQQKNSSTETHPPSHSDIREVSTSDEDAGEHPGSQHIVVPLEYFLETVVNPLPGKGSEPPRMLMSADYRQTRLLLKKRSDHRISCDTKEWIKGREAYYIQCIRKMYSGYLCVKERNSYHRQQLTAQQNGTGEGGTQQQQRGGAQQQQGGGAQQQQGGGAQQQQGGGAQQQQRGGAQQQQGGGAQQQQRGGAQQQQGGGAQQQQGGGAQQQQGGGAQQQQGGGAQQQQGGGAQQQQRGGAQQQQGGDAQQQQRGGAQQQQRGGAQQIDAVSGNIKDRFKVCVRQSISTYKNEKKLLMLFRLQPAE